MEENESEKRKETGRTRERERGRTVESQRRAVASSGTVRFKGFQNIVNPAYYSVYADIRTRDTKIRAKLAASDVYTPSSVLLSLSR